MNRAELVMIDIRGFSNLQGRFYLSDKLLYFMRTYAPEDEVSSQVSERGQITIDRAARRALSVKPRMLAVQVVNGDHLEVYFLPARHRRSLFGALAAREPTPAEDWDVLEERAARSIAADA